MGEPIFGFTQRQVDLIKKLIRESGPVRSSKPGTRRTRRVGGEGGGGGGVRKQYGRVVTTAPGLTKAGLAPNEDVNGVPIPGFIWTDLANDYVQLDPPEFALRGEPIIFGEGKVEVFVLEEIPSPEKPDNFDDKVAHPATWPWPPDWPIRVREKMLIDPTKDPPKPFPRFIPNPDTDLDPIPNEDKMVKEEWDNPFIGCLLKNSFVTAMNEVIVSTSATVIRETKLNTFVTILV